MRLSFISEANVNNNITETILDRQHVLSRRALWTWEVSKSGVSSFDICEAARSNRLVSVIYICRHWEVGQLFRLSLNICIHSWSYRVNYITRITLQGSFFPVRLHKSVYSARMNAHSFIFIGAAHILMSRAR